MHCAYTALWQQNSSKSDQCFRTRLLLALCRFPLHLEQSLLGGGLLLEPVLDVAGERHLEILEVDRPAVESASLGACSHQLVGGELLRPDLCRVVENVTHVVVVCRH